MDGGVVPLIAWAVSRGAVDEQSLLEYYSAGRIRPVGIGKVG